MESHMHGASGSSPDVSRIQQGYNIQQPGPGPRGSHRPHSDRSMFGVRIQVQGIEGLPYVVLNNRDSRAALPSGGLESYSRNWDHQEVSVNAHSQSEYASIVNDKPSPLGSPYVERRLPNRQGEYALGGSLTEGRESQRTPLMSATSMFDIQESHLQQSQRTMPASNMKLNFQRHPELLKPYNPDRISLSPQHPLLFSTRRLSVPPTQTASVPRPGHLARGLQSGAGAARIPLPAGGVERAPNPVSASTQTPGPATVSAPTQTQSPGPAPVSAPALHHSSLATLLSPPNEVINVPRRSPYSVDTEPISSVGSLINQFDSPQQVGQAGPRRGRIAPEDRRRSRSVESRQERHSDPSDPSSPASAIRGARRETPGRATIAPGSPKGRGANGNSTLMVNKLQKEKEPSGYVIQSRVEKTSLTRSRSLNHTEEESERGIQIITLDLLKGQRGQQEFSTEPQPNEDATKKILFTYLKDGTIDKTSTTQKKVNLVFDRINQLKWKTAENVEEEIRDYSAKAKELQKRGAELEREVSQLKTQLEHKTMSGWSLAEVCFKAQTDMKTIQEELGRRQEELSTLRDRLAQKEAELEVAIEELVRVKAESEQGRTETKDLQQQLSEMHDELDQAKSTTQADSTEKQLLLKDLAQLRLDFQELILVQEEQEEVVHWKERELTALKGALKEEVESHDKELGIMKEVQNKEVQKLREEVEEVKESNTVLGQDKREMEEDRGEAQGQVNELMQEREELRGQVEELESRMEQLNLVIKDSKTLQRQLVKCIEQHKRAKQQVEETLVEVREKEEEMSQANKALLIRLENVQSEMSQLNHQHREVKERLKEERSRVEELRMIKTDLEEERRLYNNTVEELQKKMSVIVEGYEVSTEKLQLQVDEVREKSHTELSELQQQLQGKGVDLDKSRQTVRKLQEELLPLEQGLERCRREWEEAQQRGRELERKGEELDKRSTHAQEDHARQVKLMEGQMGDLEHDLSEERSSVDLLMDRVDQGKQQMEQIRVELLQERAVRQDLECDKITLERRNKDLKSRVSHLEGSQRSNQDVVVSRLEGRIQELEGRLEGGERDNINLQQANRKLERKVKEMIMQVEDEHISIQNQKHQMNQRLKTAKRQMDGAEQEIERLENSKRKLQRDLDEQMETNDQVLSQLNALRSEMRRKQQKSAPLMMIVKDDDMVYEDDINPD